MHTIPAVLEDIGLSFGPHAEKIEKLILDDVSHTFLLWNSIFSDEI